MIVQNGIFAPVKKDALQAPDQHHRSGEQNLSTSVINMNSETTIYENAVRKQTDTVEIDDGEVILNLNKNRPVHQTSSDEQGDTSDELINVAEFIADCTVEAERRKSIESGKGAPKEQNELDAHEAEQKIRDTEAAKIRMIATPGNNNGFMTSRPRETSTMVSSVDNNYMVIGTHVEPSLGQKIFRHEYIDFARLLPKDKVSREDDHHMELISRGGSTYFVLVADCECTGSISNFSKWEQAFRVFSNIYSKFFPDRSSELIQYNHIIYTASQTFVWENVYLYGKEFHMHMANFPERSWAVILQQVWSICLRDRV